MHIFVRFSYNAQLLTHRIKLDVEPNTKIQEIKLKIQDKTSISPVNQRLLLAGKEIATCISDYNIYNGATLVCDIAARRFTNGNSDTSISNRIHHGDRGCRRGANRGGRQYTLIDPSDDDASHDGRTYYGGTGDVFRGDRGGRGASYRCPIGGRYRGNGRSAYRGSAYRGGGYGGGRGSAYRGSAYRGGRGSAYRGSGYGGSGRGVSYRYSNYGNNNYGNGNGNGSQKSEAEHEEEESYSQSGSIGDVEQYNINSNINDNISDDLPEGPPDEQDIKNEEKLNETSKICEEIEKLATVVQKIAEQMTQQQKQLNEMTIKLNTTAEKMVQQHMVTNRDKKHGINSIEDMVLIHGYIRLIITEMPSHNILTEICTLVQFYAALSKDKKHKKQPSDVDIWQRIINDKSFSVDNEKVYLLISNVTIRMKNTKFIKQKIFEFLANIITLDDIFINDNNEFELRIHDQKYYLHAQLRMNSANAVQKAVNEAEKHIQNAVNKSAELMAWKIRQWINYENKHKRNKKMHNNRQQNQNQNRNFNTPSNFNISPNFNIPSNFNIPPNFNIPLNYNYATGILPNVPPIYYYNQNNNQ